MHVISTSERDKASQTINLFFLNHSDIVKKKKKNRLFETIFSYIYVHVTSYVKQTYKGVSFGYFAYQSIF